MTKVPSRRFVHSAHPIVGVAPGAFGLQPLEAAFKPAVERDAAADLDVCLVAGPTAGGDLDLLSLLEVYLRMHALGIGAKRFTIDTAGSALADCLAGNDCVVLLGRSLAEAARSPSLPGQDALEGKGIVILRIAGGASAGRPGPGGEIFGAEFRGPCEGGHRPRVQPVPGAYGHSALRGVLAFTAAGPLNKIGRLARNTAPLLVGTIPGRTEPVAWTHRYRGARVFATTLGQPDDFRSAGFLRLVTSAVLWAGGRVPPGRR